MAEMIEITCKCGCGRKKDVRLSDIKRGWGKFYSKSCKAKYQERKTGQYKNYWRMRDEIEAERDHGYAMVESERGWDGHKNLF